MYIEVIFMFFYMGIASGSCGSKTKAASETHSVWREYCYISWRAFRVVL